jgi:hypothetical protein
MGCATSAPVDPQDLPMDVRKSAIRSPPVSTSADVSSAKKQDDKSDEKIVEKTDGNVSPTDERRSSMKTEANVSAEGASVSASMVAPPSPTSNQRASKHYPEHGSLLKSRPSSSGLLSIFTPKDSPSATSSTPSHHHPHKGALPELPSAMVIAAALNDAAYFKSLFALMDAKHAKEIAATAAFASSSGSNAVLPCSNGDHAPILSSSSAFHAPGSHAHGGPRIRELARGNTVSEHVGSEHVGSEGKTETASPPSLEAPEGASSAASSSSRRGSAAGNEAGSAGTSSTTTTMSNGGDDSKLVSSDHPSSSLPPLAGEAGSHARRPSGSASSRRHSSERVGQLDVHPSVIAKQRPMSVQMVARHPLGLSDADHGIAEHGKRSIGGVAASIGTHGHGHGGGILSARSIASYIDKRAHGDDVLQLACAAGSADVVELFLDRDPTLISLVNSHTGNTLLHYAALGPPHIAEVYKTIRMHILHNPDIVSVFEASSSPTISSILSHHSHSQTQEGGGDTPSHAWAETSRPLSGGLSIKRPLSITNLASLHSSSLGGPATASVPASTNSAPTTPSPTGSTSSMGGGGGGKMSGLEYLRSIARIQVEKERLEAEHAEAVGLSDDDSGSSPSSTPRATTPSRNNSWFGGFGNARRPSNSLPASYEGHGDPSSSTTARRTSITLDVNPLGPASGPSTTHGSRPHTPDGASDSSASSTGSKHTVNSAAASVSAANAALAQIDTRFKSRSVEKTVSLLLERSLVVTRERMKLEHEKSLHTTSNGIAKISSSTTGCSFLSFYIANKQNMYGKFPSDIAEAYSDQVEPESTISAVEYGAIISHFSLWESILELTHTEWAVVMKQLLKAQMLAPPVLEQVLE